MWTRTAHSVDQESVQRRIVLKTNKKYFYHFFYSPKQSQRRSFCVLWSVFGLWCCLVTMLHSLYKAKHACNSLILMKFCSSTCSHLWLCSKCFCTFKKKEPFEMHCWFYIHIIYELIFTIPETMGSPCILQEVAVKAKIYKNHI